MRKFLACFSGSSIIIGVVCGLAYSQNPAADVANAATPKAEAPKKVWLYHSGSNPFVPLAKDLPSLARMTTAFQRNDSQTASMMIQSQAMVPVELGTSVNLVATEGQASLVEIPTGPYTGTRWYTHSSFVMTRDQAEASQAKAKAKARSRRGPTNAEVDAAMARMFAEWQAQLAAQEQAILAAQMQKVAAEQAKLAAINEHNRRMGLLRPCSYVYPNGDRCEAYIEKPETRCVAHKVTYPNN